MSEKAETNLELQRTFESEVRREYALFKTNGKSVADDIVAHVNRGRKIGLILKEWCEAESLQGNFFNFKGFCLKHEAQLGFGLIDANMFVSISNKLPKPAQTLEDARPVFQLDMVAAGILEIPVRVTQQIASKNTPLNFITTKLLDVKQKCAEWMEEEPFDSWNKERRRDVKEQLQWAADLYAKL